MDFSFPHEITYTNKGRVAIPEIAKSLIANEQLLLQSVKIFENSFPGLTIEKTSIGLRSIEHQSPLHETLILSFYATHQRDLEQQIPKLLDDITGLHIASEYSVIVNLFFLLVILYIIQMLFGQKEKPTQAILLDYENALQEASEKLKIPKSKIVTIIQNEIGKSDKKSLKRSVIQFLAPAKKEKGASINIGHDRKISSRVILDTPSYLDLDDDSNEIRTELEKVVISLRATDIDKNKSGWAGQIARISESRLKMEVYPTVKLSELHGKKNILGDVIIVSKRQDDGSYRPYMFHLIKVHKRTAAKKKK